MDEFLESIHFNNNNDLLMSSSFLTHQKWSGYVAYFNNKSVQQIVAGEYNHATMKASGLKTSKRFSTGVTVAKWLSDDRFIVANELGELELFRINLPESCESVTAGVPFREHDSLISSLDTKLDSQLAITGSHDTTIKVWDMNELQSTSTFHAHEDSVRSVNLNPNDPNMFISCSEDNTALIWDTRKETPAFHLNHGLVGYPSCAAWYKARTSLIAVGSETGQLGVYDTRSLKDKPFCVQKAHDRLIRQVKFNDGVNLIATASEDAVTNVYCIISPSDLNPNGGLLNLCGFKHNDYVTDLAWSPTNQYEYFTCSWDGTLKRHLVDLSISNGYLD